MKYNIILATDANFGISKNKEIPWNIKEDMIFFKEKTINQIVIMGRNTAESLKKPLINRINICISSTLKKLEGFIIVKSLEEALNKCKEYNKEIYIIGGSKLYNDCIKLCNFNNIYLTLINKLYNCDNIINIQLDNPEYNYEIIERKICKDKNNNEDIELIFYKISLKN